jgi:Relaxase/Mobilisation nuclease domain
MTRIYKKGQAECLYAGNMLRKAPNLTAKEKRFYLSRLHDLNNRVQRKTMHLFLSWHRSDILDDCKMCKVVRDYLQEMGLSKQPYLIYRHFDTAQPHAHVVTTNIRPDGTRIGYWRAERLKRFGVSRQLEMKYGLHVDGHRLPDDEWARQNPAQKIVYGVTPLKATMNAVLQKVMSVYKYTSLEELNALLKGYNMRAIRGAEHTVTYRNNGLLYFPLKESGERLNMYIKASALACSPTFTKMQALFAQNIHACSQYKQRLTTAIDWIFHNQQVSQPAFRQALLKEKIRIVEGPERKRGFFYIDELTKTVYEGERLGPKYSAEAIADRCISEQRWQQQQSLKQEQKQSFRQRPKIDLY